MLKRKEAIIITSINAPNRAMRMFAKGAQANGIDFYIIGDTKSPCSFKLEGSCYYGIERQLESGLEFAKACPTQHYSRKNIGYLIAMQNGAQTIIDTDDDNLPRASFWTLRTPSKRSANLRDRGWSNIYRYFSEALIWPRGLPLNFVNSELPEFEELPIEDCYCPIQQGLADENPDVDAIYRLLLPLPQNFRDDREVSLSGKTWCPFNSQNTTWFQEAFPLLYLPSHCSFRMTDIWRSFVAQRIARENGWSIHFHKPTVWQERNDHSLTKDFDEEVPGYLHNEHISEALDSLTLQSGKGALTENLKTCYGSLVANGWVGAEETKLLEIWCRSVEQFMEASNYRC